MTTRPLKSTAREWAASKRPAQKYRDRKVVTLPNGVKREFFGYGPTKRAATQDLYTKIEAAEMGARALAQVDTVNQVMAKLMKHKRSVRGRKRKTIFNDLDVYKRHIRKFIGHNPITEVTLEDLEDIQTTLTGAKKYRTAELATILLRSIYKQALRHYRPEIRSGRLALFDLTEDLEPINRPAEAEHRPNDLWTVDELAAFLKAGKKHYDASLRHLTYPLLHTAIGAGLRRGELLHLRRQDIITTKLLDGTELHLLDVTEQYVYYDGKHHRDTPKSRNGERQVPIGPELLQVLRAHMAKLDKVAKHNPDWEPTDLLFPSFNGRPMDPRNIYRARDKVIELASKDLKRPLSRQTLHELRGVYLTYVTRELVRQGKYSPKIAMRLAGHGHPHVALEHYNRVIEADLAGAVFDPTLADAVPVAIPVPEPESGEEAGGDRPEKQEEAPSVTVTGD